MKRGDDFLWTINLYETERKKKENKLLKTRIYLAELSALSVMQLSSCKNKDTRINNIEDYYIYRVANESGTKAITNFKYFLLMTQLLMEKFFILKTMMNFLYKVHLILIITLLYNSYFLLI